MPDEFIKEDLEFFLPVSFKGLSKKYILENIFNSKIQDSWNPKIGDIIVGCTGNVFIISAEHKLLEKLGGTIWMFGGFLTGSKGFRAIAYTMNLDGLEYDFSCNKLKEYSPYHSSIKDFRFVPYPHEISKEA